MGQVDTIEILGGTSGQVLATAGDGNLYWTTVSGGAGGNLSVYEGLDLIATANSLYFNGPLVDVTNVFDTPQVQIGLTVKDEGTRVGVEKAYGTINFIGSGVSVAQNGTEVNVTIPGVSGGASVSAPFIRVYTGNATTRCTNTNYWYPLPLDDMPLVNNIGAIPYINGTTLLSPGTYFFESTVYLNCTGSDTLQGAYVCLISNPLSSLDPLLGENYPSGPAPTGAVLAKAGVTRIGDYSTTPIMGIGSFTISVNTYVSLAFSQYDTRPQAWSFGDEFSLGYNTTILKLWKTA